MRPTTVISLVVLLDGTQENVVPETSFVRVESATWSFKMPSDLEREAILHFDLELRIVFGTSVSIVSYS